MVSVFGIWTYVIIFLIVFAETGLVVTPFLPGDSLIFAVGTLAGAGVLDIRIAYAILLAAAVAGDTLNYWIGHNIGHRLFINKGSRIFNRNHLDKTKRFFEKYGGKTIVLARFVPIVRTFAPFVAGIGKMQYAKFLFYNITGGFLWVTAISFSGFYFGTLPFVKENYEYVVVMIVIISIMPMAIEYLKHKRRPEKAEEEK